MKSPPLPEPTQLDHKAMSEYVSELAAGVQLEQAGKYAEARQRLEQLVAKWPGQYQAYHHLGQICDRQKRYAEAQEFYQRSILLAQNREPAIFNDLGYSYFLQGNLPKAESVLRKAVALRPNDVKFHNNLGLIYGNQRRFEEAWKEFRAAGGEADACYNMAFVKASLSDFEGAKACFRRTLAVDPSHERTAAPCGPSSWPTRTPTAWSNWNPSATTGRNGCLTSRTPPGRTPPLPLPRYAMGMRSPVPAAYLQAAAPTAT